MKTMPWVLGMVLGMAMAALYAGAVASEPPDAATDEAKPEATADTPVAAAETAGDKKEPLTPPPGFKLKRYGKHLLYCKRDAPMGTRLKSERCLDEEQMRNYLLALEAGKVDIDRTRAICSNPCVCGMPC